MLTRALVCPALVGRDRELQELVECRLAAARSHGSMVLVSGDAGIGKSRLLSAFRATLRGSRSAVGIGLCREFGNAPYGPVSEALRGAGAAPPLSIAESRPEQLAKLVSCISDLCARRAVVLILEDIHWADDGTLLFLNSLLPTIPGLRLFVVATCRSDDVQRTKELQPYFARMMRSHAARTMTLQPLDAADMRRLIRLALGPERALQPALLEEIVERSDGNPFFAEELLENALERKSEAAPRELPLTVRATVLERVRGLDPSTREALYRASVLGRRFDAGLLAELCGMERAAVLPMLRQLRNLQLIDEVAEAGAVIYEFRHALTHEAIYGEMLVEETRPLHAQILRALERRGSPAGDLGYHAWAAAEREPCLVYNERAGDEAHSLHVYREAVRSFDRAISTASSEEVRARLLVKSGRSCASDGKAAQAADRYAAAAELYEACGLGERSRDAYLLMSAQARVSGDSLRPEKMLEKTLAGMDAERADESAPIAVALAYLRLDRGDVESAKALLEQASAIAGTPSHQNAVQYATLVSGNVREFRAASELNAAIHNRLGDLERLRAAFNRAFGFAILGFDNDAVADFEAILPELRGKRLSSLEIPAYGNLALLHANAGRFSDAKNCLERAAVIPEQTTTGPIVLAAAALTVGFATSDEDLIARFCAPEIVEAAFSSHINSTLGRIAGPYATWLAATGDRGGAESILTRAMRALKSPFGATQTFVAAAEFGGAAAREAALSFLRSLAGMPEVPLYAATAQHLRALRALHAGEDAAKAVYARKAFELYGELQWPMHQTACIELLGDFKRAATRYRKLCATGLLRQLKVTDQAIFAPASALSSREREIASLVAHGTVNKQIAERLSVNQRTVEKHLTAIYAKLGLRNRSELAAYVTRHDRRSSPRTGISGIAPGRRSVYDE